MNDLEATVACGSSISATLRDLEARCVVRCSASLLAVNSPRYQIGWRVWAAKFEDAQPAGRGWRPDPWDWREPK